MDFNHISVLLNECIEGLNIKKDGIYVDGTLGGAGHSTEICNKLSKKGHLIGIDQDDNALKSSAKRLEDKDCKVTLIKSNFSDITNQLKIIGIDQIDGLLLDLGVSSHQLDEANRGFSYMQDAPLDMRMDQDSKLSAYEVVNTYSKQSLIKIIKDYGEERWADRIAEFICTHRKENPIKTTFDLVDIIKGAIPKAVRRDGPHPAKRTFQAIRIEVNNELGIIQKTIEDGVDLLKPGGRICIITFHSLEDRIVKQTYRKLHDPCTCPREFPICICDKKSKVKIISRRPVLPTKNEVDNNPRSRSAKLRIAEKKM